MNATDSDQGGRTIPRHVAIIMDGNGRWAKKRLLPRFAGHKRGLEAVRKVIRCCADEGVEVLTLFAFSSENWRRPREEVGLLMNLFMAALDNEVRKLHENGVRLRIIGDVTAFEPPLQERIRKAEALTADNNTLHLNIAANYGGRWDITQAVRAIAAQVEQGAIKSDEVSEAMIAERLCLHDLPEPDLFIRSGGEQRISNFLLWNLAYSEMYFTDLLWPDFDAKAFAAALDSFASRQRRFGRTGDQVAAESARAPAVEGGGDA